MTAQPGDLQPARERYEREAQDRLAARVGTGRAEEFFSVARSTQLNTVNVAELMAAAWKQGQSEAASQEAPVYAKVPQEGTRNQWAVTWDEGWRSGVLCEGMYEHDADLVLRALGRRPRRA